MSQILHIDASYSDQKSVSRVLSQEFITTWKKFHPEDEVLYRRDLGRFPVPYINAAWITAVYSPSETHTPEMIAALERSTNLRRVLICRSLCFWSPNVWLHYSSNAQGLSRTFDSRWVYLRGG